MILNNAYEKKINDQYRANTVFTSTPEELTLMLYNGIIKFIMQARAAISEKNIEKANNGIIRAQDILAELQTTLDMKYEVSEKLVLLYDYMYRRLIEANVRKDENILEEVLGFVKELRDVWTQAMKIAKKQDRVKEA